MDNNNYNNDDNTSQSPVVAALRRHFHPSVTNKEIADNTLNSMIDNTELDVKKVITVRPLGFRNGRR